MKKTLWFVVLLLLIAAPLPSGAQRPGLKPTVFAELAWNTLFETLKPKLGEERARVAVGELALGAKPPEDADLVITEKRGRARECRLGPAQLRDAARWIEEYHWAWQLRLDSFGTYVEQTKAPRR